ncbi:MAG: FemAB family PEP-CTERM system-associated protein [Bryobacteraceae bacterium]|nr:FemAB family PEP-CTERM system-associated protein [Bryobacteraceae bacterium]
MSEWRVREFQSGDEPAWDRFVRAHHRGSPFHLLAWQRCLQETFGYRPNYLIAERAGAWGAVLPLFECQGWFSGKAWISTPFAVYGGALSINPDATATLAADLRHRAEAAEVQFVDLRNGWEDQRLGFTPVDRYVTFIQTLQSPDQEQLLSELPKKTRNMVRKALKTPFRAKRSGRDWARFARFHGRTLHRLGTPSFPEDHFRRIVEYFGDEAELFELWLEDQLAAASLNFVYAGSAHIYYAGADPRFNALAANYAMYNDHLLNAAARGLAEFDFGRCKLGAGTFEFKKHWATQMRALPYEMLLVKRTALPDLTPKNPKFSLAIEIWRRLPLWLTRRLGPVLVKQFP